MVQIFPTRFQGIGSVLDRRACVRRLAREPDKCKTLGKVKKSEQVINRREGNDTKE
jgi:hypothetical protein